MNQRSGLEDIDSHVDQAKFRPPGNRFGVLWLFFELHDAALTASLQDTHASSRTPVALDRSNSNLGAPSQVGMDHLVVIHLVDMIAGQHYDTRRAQLLQDVDVLKHRIRAPLVPVAAHPKLGWHREQEITDSARKNIPTLLQVLLE